MRNASPGIELRERHETDFEPLFRMSQDQFAHAMSMVHPLTREQFEARWNRTPQSPHEQSRIILLDGVVVGKVGSFAVEDEIHVGYQIAQAHWGKGVATRALGLLAGIVEHRPLIAHVAVSNIGSRRVLEKCGFVKIDERQSDETERYLACIEAIYRLD